jgi:hypothetical protein
VLASACHMPHLGCSACSLLQVSFDHICYRARHSQRKSVRLLLSRAASSFPPKSAHRCTDRPPSAAYQITKETRYFPLTHSQNKSKNQYYITLKLKDSGGFFHAHACCSYHPAVCYSLAKSASGISAAPLPHHMKIDSGFLPTDDVVRLSFRCCIITCALVV